MRVNFLKTGILVLFLFSGTISAEPPKIKIPEIKPSGDYITMVPETDAVSVTYIGFSVDPFPNDQLKNPISFVLPIRGLEKQIYKFSAVAASKTGEQTRVDFKVDLTDIKTPPIVTPDPNPNTVNYLLIVRPNGNASPSFTKIMQDDTWNQLNLPFKDKTYQEAIDIGIVIPNGTTLPAVFHLNNGKDKSTTIKISKFPTNSEEIRGLK